ncbi:recombinase family protein [Sphingobacterium multivorum]|uniref:recombinase family protein n=1 Tax=Sphingobacterium multivorum TaxID=28454 RepID=UPI000E9B6A51|nr:recombinase family protein [Sphingobacterium multivorum]HAF33276.1 hypothetical protein [Sphingobacterium sp.]HBI89194.1 hypothetical protein [Sphingobacterium sp.]
MNVKYNRVSTIVQSGNRFKADSIEYDLTLLDRVSGSVAFSERENGKKILSLVKDGKVNSITVEELSRLGRNHIDVITTLDYFERHTVNVIIKNLGISSIVNGAVNPIWKIIISVLSTMYSLEVENIRERTRVGRLVFVKNGGKLGRPNKSVESEKVFMDKQKSKIILQHLKKGKSVRDISRIVNCSSGTVMKVKKIFENYK